MITKDIAKLQAAAERSWSIETAKQWTSATPAAGQCNVTAIVVQELAGGDIRKTPMAGGFHFYNWIDGCRHDLTAAQFDQPVDCADMPSDRAEAMTGVTDQEYRSFRSAMQRAIER